MVAHTSEPMEAMYMAVMTVDVLPPNAEGTIAPQEILTFLARLRLLQGVPFNNIVPDTELLPNESIRFFYLDRAWTDAIVQGALSVATGNTIERAQLERLYPQIEKEIDEAERQVRAPGGEPALTGEAGLVTGFLMRSAAVAGWPGMHVRAYSQPPAGSATEVFPESHPSRIKLLRLERLSPAVLLCLFDGLPKVLHIEEPRQGLQFGYNLHAGRRGSYSATVPARNVRSAEYVNAAGVEQDDPNDAAQIPVRFRRKAPGVLDLTNTARNFADEAATSMNLDGKVDGAEFAMQMIRFPYRQIFAQDAGTTATQNDAFKPSLGDVTARYTAELKARIERS
ncbi:hypothetical protein MUY35_01245 [Aliiroseovarius sp. S1339]|uniref:hypothetical protein n=1 Tax=Aliiroseovarius sp. S1339 TaxID=2936990 RepID=UPI0020C02AB7|nr:hypothetical protein [Aliiroseovarius sp. S1339]MCK8462472.1 hypothetical protein [Aliiroseovarius sp. S1339]